MTLLTSLMWRNGDAIYVCTMRILELAIHWQKLNSKLNISFLRLK